MKCVPQVDEARELRIGPGAMRSPGEEAIKILGEAISFFVNSLPEEKRESCLDSIWGDFWDENNSQATTDKKTFLSILDLAQSDSLDEPVPGLIDCLSSIVGLCFLARNAEKDGDTSKSWKC